MRSFCAVLLLWFQIRWVSAFVLPLALRQSPSLKRSLPLLSLSSDDQSAPIDEDKEIVDSEEGLSDERKQTLFEYLLRDLQVEGIPLLGCDADQIHTLQAAIWTTMAELLEQPPMPPSEKEEESEENGQKVCLIFESIPMEALQSFVDDFLMIKEGTTKDTTGQQSSSTIAQYLPELQRISVSLLGKGLGPAMLIEVAALPPDSPAPAPRSSLNEFQCSAAMKVFMNRVVVGSSSDSAASLGLADEGSAAPLEYQFTPASDACGALSMFWNCVCQLLATPDTDLGTLCLQLPGFSGDGGDERFLAVSELMSRSLALFRGDSVFSLVYFHPRYDRSRVQPADGPAFGHLPPTGWLKSMLKEHYRNDGETDVDSLTAEQLGRHNYQRRAPLPAVNIVRNSLLGEPRIVVIEVEGRPVQASGLETYCPNTRKLAAAEEEVFRKALQDEMDILAK